MSKKEGIMKLQRKRLRELADHLDRIKPERFNMKEWFNKSEECGTSACAMGHACMMKRFQKLGLHLVQDVSSQRFRFWSSPCAVQSSGENKEWEPQKSSDVSSQRARFPVFRGEQGMGAAEKFFGLTQQDAEYLFGDTESLSSPKAKAAVIRDFVEFYPYSSFGAQ
jgi:hypothetical protein